MAPKTQTAAYTSPPDGYAWATDVAAEGSESESDSSKSAKSRARDVPSLCLNSSLVFHMAEPPNWDQLLPQAKLQKKREYLCAQWGEENFTFFEDAPSVRKYYGRIQVRNRDYYAHFEVWDAEHFNVQYHNSMTLLEDGLKMDDDDFKRLQTSLGIVDAEFLHAFNDWECHCGPLKVQKRVELPKARVKSHTAASTKRLPATAATPKNLSKQSDRPRESAFGTRQSLNVKAPRAPQAPLVPQACHALRAALNHPQILTSTRPAAHTTLEPPATFDSPQVDTAAQRVHRHISRNSADVVIKNHLVDVTSSRGNRIMANSNSTQNPQPQPTSLSVASPAQNKGKKRAFSEVKDSSQQTNLPQYNFQQSPSLSQSSLPHPSPQQPHQLWLSPQQPFLSPPSHQQSCLPQPSQPPNKRIRTQAPRRRKTPLFLRHEASRNIPQSDFQAVPQRLCDPEMYGQGLNDNQHRFADEEAIREAQLATVLNRMEKAAKASAKNEEEARIILRISLAKLFSTVKSKFSYQQELREFDHAPSPQFYRLIYNLWIKGMALADPLVVSAIEAMEKVGDQAMSEEEKLLTREEMLQYVHYEYHAQWWQMVIPAIIAARSLNSEFGA